VCRPAGIPAVGEDKFIVRDAETEANIWWDNNAAMSPASFAALKADSSPLWRRRRRSTYRISNGGSQPSTAYRSA